MKKIIFKNGKEITIREKEGILTRDFYINEKFYDSVSMGLLID